MQASSLREKSPDDKKQHRKAVLEAKKKKKNEKESVESGAHAMAAQLNAFWSQPVEWAQMPSIEAAFNAWEQRMVKGVELCERAVRLRASVKRGGMDRENLFDTLWKTDLGALRELLDDKERLAGFPRAQWEGALCAAPLRLHRLAQEQNGAVGAPALRRLTKTLLSKQALALCAAVWGPTFFNWSLEEACFLRQKQREILELAWTEGAIKDRDALIERGLATELLWANVAFEAMAKECQPSWTRDPRSEKEAIEWAAFALEGVAPFGAWATRCEEASVIGCWAVLGRHLMLESNKVADHTRSGSSPSTSKCRVWREKHRETLQAWGAQIEHQLSCSRSLRQEQARAGGGLNMVLRLLPRSAWNTGSLRQNAESSSDLSELAREVRSSLGTQPISMDLLQALLPLGRGIDWGQQQQQATALWNHALDALMCTPSSPFQLVWAQLLVAQGGDLEKEGVRKRLIQLQKKESKTDTREGRMAVLAWLETRAERRVLEKAIAPPKDPDQKGLFFKHEVSVLATVANKRATKNEGVASQRSSASKEHPPVSTPELSVGLEEGIRPKRRRL